jgi:hypothetical protein
MLTDVITQQGGVPIKFGDDIGGVGLSGAPNGGQQEEVWAKVHSQSSGSTETLILIIREPGNARGLDFDCEWKEAQGHQGRKRPLSNLSVDNKRVSDLQACRTEIEKIRN